MTQFKFDAVWLALSFLILTACSSPTPTYSRSPVINRHLENGSRHYHAGHLFEARASFEAAVAAAELIDSSNNLVESLMAKAACELLLGNPESAAQGYTRALEEARFSGLQLEALQAQIALADIHRRKGEIDIARLKFESLRPQLAAASPDLFALDQGLALIYLAENRPDLSNAILEPWITQIAGLPLQARAVLTANMARVQLALGQIDAAMVSAQSALALDKQSEHPPAIAAGHSLLALVLRHAGSDNDANTHAVKAQRIRAAMGLPENTAVIQRGW